MKQKFAPWDVFVSTAGSDQWTGRLDTPNADKSDGPLATLDAARRLIRERRRKGVLPGPATVWVRGGRYPMERPLVFEPADSGPVAYAAYPGEEPVLDGGAHITGWSETQTSGRRVWVVDVSALLKSPFSGLRQLFANGRRRPRTRLPKSGYYWIEAVPGLAPDSPFNIGSNVFRAAAGDFRDWKNLRDVDVVVLHYWSEERMPVASYDPESRLVTCSRRSAHSLNDDVGNRFAKYYIENVFEALTEPGEWYLDRSDGRLYYLPVKGETPANTDVVVTHLLQMVRIEGRPFEGAFVEFLRFQGLAFEYTDWIQPRGGGVRFDPYVLDAMMERTNQNAMMAADTSRMELASGGQAAHTVPGVITMRGARHCALQDCRLEHLGWYGVEIVEGCSGIGVTGCTIADTGGGGIKVDGAHLPERWKGRTENNVISDNHINHCGEAFMASVGILLQHTAGNLVAHNYLHDMYYTAISCGWVWGYGPSVARDNHIEKNHIHNLGKGVLSDMGGVYLLGVQPGTTVRGNLVHDVERCNYGGWAIYPDEGSSHIVIENNISYNTSSQPFHQHYGRENIVRNNIWAFGREGLAAFSRGSKWNSGYVSPGRNTLIAATFERNIFITDGEPVFVGALADATGNLEGRFFRSDLNLFFDVSGREIVSGNGVHGKHGRENLTRVFTFREWQALGYDLHSVVADPRCRDLGKMDFTLLDDSPALVLGFEPIDMSDVGPRPPQKRVDEPDG